MNVRTMGMFVLFNESALSNWNDVYSDIWYSCPDEYQTIRLIYGPINNAQGNSWIDVHYIPNSFIFDVESSSNWYFVELGLCRENIGQ